MPFVNRNTINFIGNGLTFPLILNNGKVKIETGTELIRSSLKILLSWNIPRFFLYEYYSPIYNLLEEPNDDLLMQQLEAFVLENVSKWEKRVQLTSFTLYKNSAEKLDVEISYIILNTQQTDSLIFPFYKNLIY